MVYSSKVENEMKRDRYGAYISGTGTCRLSAGIGLCVTEVTLLSLLSFGVNCGPDGILVAASRTAGVEPWLLVEREGVDLGLNLARNCLVLCRRFSMWA